MIGVTEERGVLGTENDSWGLFKARCQSTLHNLIDTIELDIDLQSYILIVLLFGSSNLGCRCTQSGESV